MRQKITFLLFAVFALSISAQTVNIQGDPYTGNPYGTIQEAIDASTNPADVILITGEHTGSITINKSITLRGTDPTMDIIQAVASLPTPDGSGSRVISLSPPVNTDVLTITIENLGVRYGNANSSSNGGGINADKIMGLLTLKNLIIKDNYTANNGGGLGIAGSNANIINCTIEGNSSAKSGGGIILAPNNNQGNGINSFISIKQSLINNNTSVDGGGIYINGNKGSGNNYKIDVNIENSTISNNTGTTGTAGGGAIWSKCAFWTGDNTTGNVTLRLIHATVYNNAQTNSLLKSGIQFTSDPAGAVTNFSAYNSIIVGNDDLSAETGTKALNFANSNTTNVVNCIIGGTNLPPTIVSDPIPNANNNEPGKTATYAGLSGTLANEGGSTQVLAITESSIADDYCTAATGITLPTIDQRGYIREGVADAGAYEFGGTLSVDDAAMNVNTLKVYPNPARDFVKISSTNTITSVKVYSILGALEKVVYNQKDIDVSSLSSGVHLMFIESDGQNVIKRLIIE